MHDEGGVGAQLGLALGDAVGGDLAGVGHAEAYQDGAGPDVVPGRAGHHGLGPERPEGVGEGGPADLGGVAPAPGGRAVGPDMATFVLIHGAGDDSWYWHRVRPLLEAEGHEVVAPDLPCEDDAADLSTYTDVVVDALGDRDGPCVVVAQSLGGLVAPLVADRVRVDLLVLLAAMVPLPGEAPADLWANTGLAEDRRVLYEREGWPTDGDLDPARDFLHDLPPDLLAEALARPHRDQSGTPFVAPWPLERWPDVPTRFVLARDDRFFPAEHLRRVVPERLGIIPDEIPGGHCVALSQPGALVARLLALLAEADRGGSGPL